MGPDDAGRPRRIVFGLREREGGVSIGDSRLAPGPGSRTARFSIMIGDRRFRGRGMGTEATWLVCRYGFDQLGLEEIRLEVDPQNAAAVRAYESVGFVHGRRRSMRLQRAVSLPRPCRLSRLGGHASNRGGPSGTRSSQDDG